TVLPCLAQPRQNAADVRGLVRLPLIPPPAEVRDGPRHAHPSCKRQIFFLVSAKDAEQALARSDRVVLRAKQHEVLTRPGFLYGVRPNLQTIEVRLDTSYGYCSAALVIQGSP